MQRIKAQQSYILLFFVFCFILYLGVCSPLNLGDDYIYQYIYNQKTLYEPLPYDAVLMSSWADVLYSLKQHYFLWHGRLTNHLLFLSMLYIGKPYSDIFVAFMSIVLFVVVYWVCNRGEITYQFNINWLYVILFSFWTFTLSWGTVFIWVGGATNYLYTSVFVLLFVLPYIRYYFNKSVLSTTKMNWLMGIAGLFVGCTNENSIPVILLGLAIYLYKDFRIKPLWMKIGFISLFCGFMIMLIAPGNRGRLVCELGNYVTVYEHYMSTNPNFNVEELALLKNVVTDTKAGKLLPWLHWFFIKFNVIGLSSAISANIFFFVYILSGSYLIIKSGKNYDKKLFTLSIVFAFGGVLSLLMLCIIPYMVARSFFFSLVFFIVSTVMIMRILQEEQIEMFSKLFKKFMVGVCMAYALYSIFTMTYNATIFHQHYENEFISYVKSHPNCEIVVELPKNKPYIDFLTDIHKIGFYSAYGPIEEGKIRYLEWYFSSFARYHHLKDFAVYYSDTDTFKIYCKKEEK